MQDSFLDAFRKIRDYAGEGNFGGWLRRIVVNNSLDALKKRKQEVALDLDNVEIPDQEDQPSENVEYRIEEIKRALTLLPEDYR